MSESRSLPTRRTDTDADPTDTIAALQARNAELERQLHDCQTELQIARMQLRESDQSHHRLHQTQNQLTDILKSAIVSIINFRLYADRHFEHFYCSPGSKAIFGYEPEELIDTSFWWSCIPPEDHAIILASNDALFAGQLVRQEYRFRHQDGSLRWIEGTLTAHRDHSADCWLVTAVDVDITDRKTAETALTQKIARERLITAMIQRIRQSLDVDEILRATVTEVRQFLDCDRVLIYQFNANQDIDDHNSGHVAYEAVGAEWRSLLGMELGDRGFLECLDDYLTGRVQCTADIYTAQLPDCYIAKQAELQVRANLVVPIVKQARDGIGKKLWGLLAAQYCAAPHDWQNHDVELLQDLAAQVAIALQQSMLHRQVQASESTLSQILDTVPASIFRLRFFPGGDHQLLYSSAGCEQIYGYTPAELIADPKLWRSRVLTEDYTAVLAPLYDAYFVDCPMQFEFRFRHKDGSIRWIAGKYYVDRTQSADWLVVTAIDLDITDRKQAELALRGSEARFQEIAQTIDQMFFVRSATTGQFLYVTPAYETIFGRTCDSLYADPNSWLGAIHPDDRHLVSASVAQQLAGNAVTREYRIVRPDGEVRWLLAEIKLVYDAAGNPDRFIGFATDITTRKQTELAFQQSEIQKRAILAAVPDMMVLFSADGTYLGIIQESRTLFNLIDETADPTLVGRHIDQLLPPEMAVNHMRCIQQALATGEVQIYEKVVSVNNYLQYEEVRVAPVDAQTVLLMVRDISDRKQAELALEKQMRREQALTTVIEAIHHSLDLETIFTTATREITQLLAVGRAAIVQYCPEQHCWKRVAFWQGDHGDVLISDSPVPDVGNPFAEQLKRGEIVMVDAQHPIQDPINQALAVELSPPWLLAPIMVNHVTWGCLTITSNPRSRWQADEIDVAMQVAEQLAIAIHQAQLYHHTQTANASLEQLTQTLEIEIEERTRDLRQSEELFRSLFEHAPIGIALCSFANKQLLQVNQKICQITGYSRNELVMMTVADITHPDDVEQEHLLMMECIAGTRSHYQIEKRYITKQGTIRWVQVTATALFNPVGQPVCGLGMIEDVTDRRQMQAALQRSEAQNRAILAAVPDLMVLWSADGKHVGVIQPSHTLLDLLDVGNPTTPDLIGKHLSELLPPDIAAQQETGIQRALATGEVQTYEQVLTIADRVQYEEVRLIPVDDQIVLLMVRDIGDRKRAEAKIAASLREKELLLKEIHHRVKNNLQTICSLLSLQANTFEDPRIIEPLLESQRRVRTMALVHERLYQTESLATIDIADYITELVQDSFQSSVMTTSAIDLRFDVMNLTLEADTAIACGLIINELVSNVLKHAFPDDRPGELWIRFVPHPTIANTCLLTVADNGIGIPETFDIQTTDSLGLQVVFALVAQIEGTLEIELRSGTAFHITVPLTTLRDERT